MLNRLTMNLASAIWPPHRSNISHVTVVHYLDRFSGDELSEPQKPVRINVSVYPVTIVNHQEQLSFQGQHAILSRATRAVRVECREGT